VKKYQREQIWTYYPQDCSLKKPVKKAIGKRSQKVSKNLKKFIRFPEINMPALGK